MSTQTFLPEWMNARVVERTYRRMLELQEMGGKASRSAAREVDKAPAPSVIRSQPKSFTWQQRRHARHMRKIGMRMAEARDPRFMTFLEKSAEYLRARNDEQQSRLAQLGYQRTEYGEYALFRTAYEKADDPKRDLEAMYAIWGWVYAAVAEALQA